MKCEDCDYVRSCLARDKIIDPTLCNFRLAADNKNAKVIPLRPYPPNCNPMQHDLFNMGVKVTGAWMALTSEHAGIKQDHNKTEEEKASKDPVFYDDPKSIIMVNCKTGARFKLIFPR